MILDILISIISLYNYIAMFITGAITILVTIISIYEIFTD